MAKKQNVQGVNGEKRLKDLTHYTMRIPKFLFWISVVKGDENTHRSTLFVKVH